MKAQEDLDHIFQQRLQNMEVTPPAFVWPAVENELRKRRRRFAFWLFFGGTIGIGLLAATWMWLQQPTTTTVSILQEVQVQRQGESSAAPASQGLANTADTQGVKEAENERISSVSVVETREPTVQSANNNHRLNIQPVENKPVLRTDSPAKQAKNKPSVASNKNKQPRPNPASTLAKVDQTIKGVTATANGFNPLQGLTKSANAASTAANNTPQSAGKINAQDVVDMPVATGHTVPVQTPESTLLLPRSLQEPIVLDHKLPALAPVKKLPVLPTIRKKKEPKNCYDFEKHRMVLLIDAFLGPSFARKSLSSDDPENADYLAQRRNTERSDWASNIGVRGTLVFDRHFMLRAGLQYDHVGEVFEFIDPDYVQYDIRVTILNGQEYRETLGIEFGEHYLRTYNRLDMLDIPLQVGAELRSGRTGLSINAGASVNLLFWKRGAILTPLGQPAYFTPKDGTIDAFRARVGLSAVGSVQWFYHLKPRLRIFAEPYFRQVLRPVSLANQPVEQRYSIWGIKLGVTKIVD